MVKCKLKMSQMYQQLVHDDQLVLAARRCIRRRCFYHNSVDEYVLVATYIWDEMSLTRGWISASFPWLTPDSSWDHVWPLQSRFCCVICLGVLTLRRMTPLIVVWTFTELLQTPMLNTHNPELPSIHLSLTSPCTQNTVTPHLPFFRFRTYP